MFLLLLSLGQISVFVYHVILLTNIGLTVGADGPVYIQSPLIFNPDKKKEVWRFLSYMFVHSGYFHITFNVVVQVRKYLNTRVLHLDVEERSEELLRQLSYAIKNQLVASKAPHYFACSSLALYGIRAPILGPFRTWKPTVFMP